MVKRSHPGLFVVIEGVDNCGKTTQARRLAASLKRRGIDVLAIREPGGTQISEKVRRVLLSRDSKMCARCELLLYLAARAQVTAERIVPALREGKIVVADRYSLSTYAYQIGGRGMPRDVVIQADRFARHNIEPDLTFVLDITPAEAQRRLAASGRKADRIEKEKPAFFARVRRYYRQTARSGKNTILLNGRHSPADLAAEILTSVLRRRERK